METKRRPFQGVLNILSFNRHFYIYGLVALTIITIIFNEFGWSNTLYLIILSGFLYGLLIPLLVSAYVYDFSEYYQLNWLKKLKLNDSEENLHININAGFDETSFLLKDLFPKSDLKVFDFYNKKQHTEPAIVRARKISLTYPNTQEICTNYIPLQDRSADTIFLLSAIHEIRCNKEKVQFLTECHRISKPNGYIIMVEHLRDFPNFLAFTIGFTHFFSKNNWKKSFTEAGFSTFEEIKFTQFMSIFICKP